MPRAIFVWRFINLCTLLVLVWCNFTTTAMIFFNVENEKKVLCNFT